VHYLKLKEGHRFYEKRHFTADLQDDSDNLETDMHYYAQCFARPGFRRGVFYKLRCFKDEKD